MERYIGIDVHQQSCTVAVVGASGKRLKSWVVETSGAALVDAVKSVSGQCQVCIEEGTQAGWVYEILTPHVQDVVVTRVTESRGPKNDQSDAFGLAERLRLGTAHRVFKDGGRLGRLRELSRVYSQVTVDVVRVQNRLKALFRSRGVDTRAGNLYALSQRPTWLSALPSAYQASAELLYAQYDALSQSKKAASQALLNEAQTHAIAKVLESCPGMGPIRVAQLIPVVVSPHRFRTRQQFWSYCGLGVVMRSSSDWVQGPLGWQRQAVQRTRGLNRNFHRTLKHIFKGAATTLVMHQPDDPLYAYYRRLTESGTKPNLAKVSLARKIAAVILHMYKTQEVYDPTRVTTAR